MAGKSSVFTDNSAPSADAAWLNLRQNETKNLIESSGQTLSDADDEQTAKAVSAYASGGGYFYTDSGSANSHVLSPKGSFLAPDTYFDGMIIGFRAGNPNTGASTVNVAGLGVKNIKKSDGSTDPEANDINTTLDTWARYDGTNFRLINIDYTEVNNTIINGDMEISQRGSSFTSVSNGDYTLDRYLYAKTGSMVHDISKDSDTPTVAQANRYLNNSMLIDCTTADASIAAGDFSLAEQAIEGYNFAEIAQKSFTISFWVKATKTGIYCVSFSNDGVDRSYVAEYTIDTTNTWEYKTITVSASPSAGTWDYTNGIGLRVRFVLAAGSTFQTTANTWQTGNFYATSNQVNACDSTSNNFQITGVQVVKGTVATEFKRRSFEEELALCQRYFEKSYNLDVDLGTATTAGMTFFDVAAATVYSICADYKVKKRSAPSITLYDDNGVAGQVTTSVGNVAGNAILTGDHAFSGTATSVGNRGTFLRYHWAANSEL